MRRLFLLVLSVFPLAAQAAEDTESYGIGLMCPHPGSQISFYTENNQQDAAGTLTFQPGSGFTLTSDSLKDFDATGAHMVESLCDGGVAGLRIDSKRDGWVQAGKMWIPPNQEWEYGDWQDYLRKAAIWKPLAVPELYPGNPQPQPAQAYPADPDAKVVEIYPLKFTDDNGFAFVLLDEADAFNKSCAGTLTPPRGRMGWMALSSGDGKPLAVPVHTKGCGTK